MTSERLTKVFEAGSLVPLFALLKDWPQGELKALHEDLDKYHDEQFAITKAAYEKAIFEPTNFLSRKISNELDTTYMEAQQLLLMQVAEILSVVYYYLADETTVVAEAS